MKRKIVNGFDLTHCESVVGKTYTYRYYNFTDYLSVVCSERSPESIATGTNGSKDTDKPEFFGSANFEEAIKLAHDGWPEGTELVAKLKTKITGEVKPIERIRPRSYFDVSGDEVDVCRYLSGEPENMVCYEMAKLPKKGRVCKMVISCTALGHVSAKHMTMRGAAALALADALESAGISTEIWVDRSDDMGSGAVYKNSILVKSAGEFFDVDGLAFMLAHPSMARRLDWAHMERAFPYVRPGYGHSRDPDSPDADVIVGCLGSGAGHFKSEAACAEWVNNQIKNFIEGEVSYAG